MKQRISAMILLCAALLLTACKHSGTAVVGDGEAPELTQCAQYTGENASITVHLPDGWSWTAFPETADLAYLGDGITFFPDDDPEAITRLRFTDSFGVCGTDLTTEEITLSGGTVLRSYNWGGGDPALYKYVGVPGDYLADIYLSDEARAQYFDTVLYILDNAVIADGFIREAAALTLAGYDPEDKNTRAWADFDAGTGIWYVTVYDTTVKPSRIVKTCEISADGTQITQTDID